MIYKFTDNKGTFVVKEPQRFNLYLPLTNKAGTLLSAISPNLAGDIKKDNEHFLTQPSSIEDIRNNLNCRRDFFIKTGKETLRLSCPYNKDCLEGGLLYQKITKSAGSLKIQVLNFIPHDLAVEVMRITVKNEGKENVTITPTCAIPLYGRSEKNLRDHRHVSSLLNRIYLEEYGIMLKPTMVFDEKGHRINETYYFVLGFEDKKIAPTGQFPTLDYFLGDGNLISPDAIEKYVLPVRKSGSEFNGKEAIAAFRFRRKELRPQEETNYFLIMGIEEDRKKIGNIFKKLDSPKKVSLAFEETKRYWINYLEFPEFDFKNSDFNNWLIWVKLQPTLRKLFGCSFLPHFDYGKGGRGWRDLWQDALSLILIEPEKARELILSNFKGVRIDGSNATIVTSDYRFISDRNRISRVWMDHGVWPYLTLKSYIHKNGDLNILFEEATYFRDAQLKRSKEIDSKPYPDDFLLRGKNKKVYKGSILEHILIENLVQFFNVGPHNCIRLENADWNDGLDMASELGESVTFSFMYACNLYDIASLLEELRPKGKTVSLLKELLILLDSIDKPINYSDYRQKQKRLDVFLEKTRNISAEKIEVSVDNLIDDLKRKSRHLSGWLRKKEWLKVGFFNGYYDNKSKRAEGLIKNKVQMMLPSQVFAIMSGVADESQVKRTFSSIEKYLLDKRLKGFRLNTNYNSVLPNLGRAFGFSYGDKENGSFFNHMAVMLANALYKRNFVKEGFKTMNSVYEMATSNRAKIYPVLPEYFNNEGCGLYLYLTGSASWYIYTLIEETLGIKYYLGDLVINPKLTASNFKRNSIEIKFKAKEGLVKVAFIRTTKVNKSYTVKYVLLNNRRIAAGDSGFVIKKESLRNQESTIKVFLA